MVLESLLELVETLRERIDEHGAALRQSETQTRYALIDPLLRELGWDTSDPSLVIPEYRTDAGAADYALLVGGLPLMMLEAKKLGTPPEQAIKQVIGYCIQDGIDYKEEHWLLTYDEQLARADAERVCANEQSARADAEYAARVAAEARLAELEAEIARLRDA